MLGDGLASGRLSRRHVEVLRGAVNIRTDAAMAHQQDWFVARATGLGWKDFVSVVRYWANAADPDGAEPSGQVQRRGAWWRKDSDGTVHGRFRFDPIGGQGFASAIEGEVQRLWRDDATAVEPGAAWPARSAAQRRADAMVRVAMRGAGRGDAALPAPLGTWS